MHIVSSGNVYWNEDLHELAFYLTPKTLEPLLQSVLERVLSICPSTAIKHFHRLSYMISVRILLYPVEYMDFPL